LFSFGRFENDFVHLFVHFNKQAEVLELGVKLVKLVLECIKLFLMQQTGLTIVMGIDMGFQLMQLPFKRLIHVYNPLIKVIPFHLILELLLKGLHRFNSIINEHAICGEKTEIEVIVFGSFFEDGLFELLVFLEDLLVDL
jgi:hypothetical protein